MQLPIIVIFERHWDTIPKQVVEKLLPKAHEIGYDTYCIEAPSNASESEIRLGFNKKIDDFFIIKKDIDPYLSNLKIDKTIDITKLYYDELTYLIRQYVSSKHFEYIATHIKESPANFLCQKNFSIIASLGMSIKGVDIDDIRLFSASPNRTSKDRYLQIKRDEDLRINTMFENIRALQNTKREAGKGGIIFSCGAFHMRRLIQKFRENKMEEQLIPCFVHSQDMYTSKINDIEGFLEGGDHISKEYTHLLSDKNIDSFVKSIIQRVKNSMPKTEFLERNSHAETIGLIFKKCTVRAFFDEEHNLEMVIEDSITIPNVNTKEIGDKIALFQKSLDRSIPHLKKGLDDLD